MNPDIMPQHQILIFFKHQILKQCENLQELFEETSYSRQIVLLPMLTNELDIRSKFVCSQISQQPECISILWTAETNKYRHF